MPGIKCWLFCLFQADPAVQDEVHVRHFCFRPAKKIYTALPHKERLATLPCSAVDVPAVVVHLHLACWPSQYHKHASQQKQRPLTANIMFGIFPSSETTCRRSTAS